MRYALIDDATLEAAKRMEGKTVTKDTFQVAGDILALENLIQAILFYDQILYLDRTGSENNQNSRFFDSFRRFSLSEDLNQQFLHLTNKMTDEYLPCIEGGKFTDECFRAFFKALDMDIRFVWEKKSDIFFLTQRILRKEQDPDGLLQKKLLNMILVELSDKSFLNEINTRVPLLYDSDGQIINNCYTVKDKDGKEYPTQLSSQTDAFFKALNYMAFRTNLYLLIARELKADLILSPVRSVLHWCCFHRFCFGNKNFIPQMTSVVHRNNLNNIIMRKSNRSAVQQMDHINYTRDMYYPAIFVQEIPLFSLWIAEHMGGGSGLIRAAYELREEKEFAAARHHLSEISEMVDADNADVFEAMDFIMTKLNRQLSKITKKYGINTGRRSPVASCALISSMSSTHVRLPGVEEFSFRLKPEKPPVDFIRRDRFGVVFRSVREDMIRIGDLGEYFDVVTSKINYKPEAILQDFKFELDGRNNMSHWWITPM